MTTAFEPLTGNALPFSFDGLACKRKKNKSKGSGAENNNFREHPKRMFVYLLNFIHKLLNNIVQCTVVLTTRMLVTAINFDSHIYFSFLSLSSSSQKKYTGRSCTTIVN